MSEQKKKNLALWIFLLVLSTPQIVFSSGEDDILLGGCDYFDSGGYVTNETIGSFCVARVVDPGSWVKYRFELPQITGTYTSVKFRDYGYNDDWYGDGIDVYVWDDANSEWQWVYKHENHESCPLWSDYSPNLSQYLYSQAGKEILSVKMQTTSLENFLVYNAHASYIWRNPQIALSPSSISETVCRGSGGSSKTFQVWNCDWGTLNYTISKDKLWLNITPISGSSTGESDKKTHTVTYITSGLSAGTYTAEISVSDPAASNNPQIIPVSLAVLEAMIGCDTTTLAQTICEGENAASQNFQVWNCGDCTLNYTIFENISWLSVTPADGISTDPSDKNTHGVTYNTEGLTPGLYTASITIQDLQASNSPYTVNVNLTVEEAVGSLKVDLEPQQAVDDGAAWKLTGEDTWHSSGQVIEYPTGNYLLEFKEIAGWVKPAGENIIIEKDQLRQRTSTYKLPAVTIYVDDDFIGATPGWGYDHFSVIQDAIDSAVNGTAQKIIVYQGTYFENINFSGKTVSLTSLDPNDLTVVSQTVLDGNGLGSVIVFSCSEQRDSIIEGFTITGGCADSGGGIFCSDTSPTIAKNIICNNHATAQKAKGGGIYCYGGSPLITKNTIKQNTANWIGGAIVFEQSCGVVSENQIANNSASNDSGGGIMCYSGSSPQILSNTISNNHGENGGGIACWQDSSPVISDNLISDNNVPAGYGGGIFCDLGYCCPAIKNNVLIGNKAGYGGGIAGITGACPKIVNNTIVSNQADIFGGGIYGSGAEVFVGNSIIFDNQCTNGPQICLDSDWGQPLLEVMYSDVDQGSAAIYLDEYSQLVWAAGNIEADPCFADAASGDFHLKSQAGRWCPIDQCWVCDDSTSRCIDAGNPGCSLADEPYDCNNIRVNMGAYGGTNQASKRPENWSLLGDLTNDGLVNFQDFSWFAKQWLKTCTENPADLTLDQTVDTDDLTLFTEDWLKETMWLVP